MKFQPILIYLLLLLVATVWCGKIVGCTLTIGYWKTHHCRAGKDASSPRRESWPGTLEGQCANEDAAFECGWTRLEAIELHVGEYGMCASLAHQTVGAENVMATGATGTNQIDADVMRSHKLLAANCCDGGHLSLGDTERAEMEEIKTRLDEYNNGNAPGGPPHCDGYPCEVTEWSEWSECSEPCGAEGKQTRYRYIHCDDVNELDSEGRVCDGGPCCDVGEWSRWSACEGTCALGTHNRTRDVTCLPNQPFPVPDDEEEEVCDTGVPCCSWDEWSAWSECSESCGVDGGTRRRSRTQTCLDDTHPQSHTEEMPCNVGSPCCTVGEWSGWSECSKACGGGVRNRTRTKDCIDQGPIPLYDSATCNDYDCCSTSDWTPWSECDATCGGGGTETRYQITICVAGSGVDNVTTPETRSCSGVACCPPNCVTCDDYGYCTQCADEFYEKDGVCLGCPEQCLAYA